MTICIAALYGKGQGCILASDLMVTAHFPIGYEFERTDVEKIIKVAPNISVYVAVSGDMLVADEMIHTARREAESQGVTTTPNIAELVRKAYQSVRLQTIVQNELEPRGLDLMTYYNSQQRLLPQVVQMIDRTLSEHNMGIELIVAGKGENTCNLFVIMNPGQTICSDPIGFSAIGSGAPHAIYSLIESGYQRDMNKEKVKELVLKAKERSQVAPGVGTVTTVIEV